MEFNISADVSKLTSINEQTLLKLKEKFEWCIYDYIEQTILNGENICNIDLGLGVLTIIIEDDSIKYKFKPDQKLERGIVRTIANEQNPFVLNIENYLSSRLVDVYKTLF